MQVHDQFESIDAARQAIRPFVLDNGESFKVVASDKKRYIIRCKDRAGGFRIRVHRSRVKQSQSLRSNRIPVVYYPLQAEAGSTSRLPYAPSPCCCNRQSQHYCRQDPVS